MKLIVGICVLGFALLAQAMDCGPVFQLVKTNSYKALQRTIFPVRAGFDLASFVPAPEKAQGHTLHCFARSSEVIAVLAMASSEAKCLDKHLEGMYQAVEHVRFAHRPFDLAQAQLLVQFGAYEKNISVGAVLKRALARRRMKLLAQAKPASAAAPSGAQ